jgi:hypothetical protein
MLRSEEKKAPNEEKILPKEEKQVPKEEKIPPAQAFFLPPKREARKRTENTSRAERSLSLASGAASRA